MSPKEIKVGHTYVNRGAGRTRRTVLAMSTELPVQWWGNNDEPRGEMVVRFCKPGMRDSTLYLSSFAAWAGKDVTPTMNCRACKRVLDETKY